MHVPDTLSLYLLNWSELCSIRPGCQLSNVKCRIACSRQLKAEDTSNYPASTSYECLHSLLSSGLSLCDHSLTASKVTSIKTHSEEVATWVTPWECRLCFTVLPGLFICKTCAQCTPCHENLNEFRVIGICYLICEDCWAAIKHEFFIVLVYWEPMSPSEFNSKDDIFGHHLYS